MDDESRLIDLARKEIDAIAKETPVAVAHIEGYRLLGEIHRGAQGVVYRAVQESTGQSVAVKVMREGPHAGDADRARFERAAPCSSNRGEGAPLTEASWVVGNAGRQTSHNW